MEASAAIGDILRVDFAAMRFYDGAHNGQSHSQPMLLSSKEPIEQTFVYFSAKACAIITYAQAHFVVAVASRANLYLASVRWRPPHVTRGRKELDRPDL